MDEAALAAALFAPTSTNKPRGERVLPDVLSIHRELRRKGVTLQLLWEEYLAAHAGQPTYRYTQFVEHYRRYAQTLKRSMRQLHRAGEKLFIDYAGPTLPVVDPATGEVRRAHIFVAALGASNYTYACATPGETQVDWLTSLGQALTYFGGVPEMVVPDNPRALVAQPDRYEPGLNRATLECARHYQTVILPARPRKPQDKAKAEVAVQVVERVEYVPGTGSVTYGNNAMLGIINIVTRKGGDFNTAQLSAEAGSHDTYRQRATFGKRFANGADLLLSASALAAQGQNLYFPAYDTPANNHGWANGIDDDRNKRFFGKFSYEGFTIEAGYVDRKKTVPTKATQYSVFNTPFTIDDANGYLNAGYETDLGLYLYSASRFYFGHYAHEGQRVIDDPTPYAQRKHRAEWWGVDQKFVGKWFANHSILFGVEHRNDFRQLLSRDYFYPDRRVDS